MIIKKKLLTAVATWGLALGGVIAASAPAAHAATYLGGVSVLGACENQIFTNGVTLISNNVTGWRCEYNGAVLHVVYYNYNINLNAQCGVQYGSGAHASYTNYSNPYSWGCYR
ncbi:MAG: hypothetical protein M3Y33_06145 [Actinomycetota bacterium]|nr:hypothetical protein [Actinomycetota bacterium]